MTALVVAWALQTLGIGLAGAFLVVYISTVWQPWVRPRAAEHEGAKAARQLLLSVPTLVLVLFIPGAINAAAGHITTFTAVTSIAGKAIAVGLLWFPWRLLWKARP